MTSKQRVQMLAAIAILSNDEESTDLELVRHLVKEIKMTKGEAWYLVIQRERFLKEGR